MKKTKKLIHDFMKDGSPINDSLTISLADCHRLSPQLIFRNNRKVHRSIVIKLTYLIDKKLIFTKLKNFKKYNEIRKSSVRNLTILRSAMTLGIFLDKLKLSK